jgi:hypothetical protein
MEPLVIFFIALIIVVAFAIAAIRYLPENIIPGDMKQLLMFAVLAIAAVTVAIKVF